MRVRAAPVSGVKRARVTNSFRPDTVGPARRRWWRYRYIYEEAAAAAVGPRSFVDNELGPPIRIALNK